MAEGRWAPVSFLGAAAQLHTLRTESLGCMRALGGTSALVPTYSEQVTPLLFLIFGFLRCKTGCRLYPFCRTLLCKPGFRRNGGDCSGFPSVSETRVASLCLHILPLGYTLLYFSSLIPPRRLDVFKKGVARGITLWKLNRGQHNSILGVATLQAGQGNY